jgi:hypothetical protein
MKNLLVSAALVCLFTQFVNAQGQKKTYLDLNAGMGVLPTFVKDAGRVKTPALSFTADYQLQEHFSLGAFAGYSVTESSIRILRDGSTAQWTNRFSVAGLRLAARSSQMGPWNIYGGLAAGYAFSNIDIDRATLEKVKRETNVEKKSGNVLITGFVGARHSFTPKVGIFAELGYTCSLVTAGLSVRL